MSNQLFISYSHGDAGWARLFAEELQKRGLDPWIDQRNISIGENLSESLEKGLRESSAVVFLLGPNTTSTPNILFELGAAVSLNKKVISVVHGDPGEARIPPPLRQLRYIVEDSPAEAAEQVVAAVA